MNLTGCLYVLTGIWAVFALLIISRFQSSPAGFIFYAAVAAFSPMFFVFLLDAVFRRRD